MSSHFARGEPIILSDLYGAVSFAYLPSVMMSYALNFGTIVAPYFFTSSRSFLSISPRILK